MSNLHVIGVTGGGVLLISGDVQNLVHADGEILVILGVAGTDLGSLGVKSDGDLAAGLGLLSSTSVVDDGLMVIIAAVGEVHAYDIETGGPELVDGLRGVCLGSYGANDGRSAIVLLGLEGSVELGEPVDSADLLEVVQSGGHYDWGNLLFSMPQFCSERTNVIGELTDSVRIARWW